MKKTLRYPAEFAAGAVGYPLIEIAWRGYTHITMAFAGGICFLIILFINRARLPVVAKAGISAALITLFELFAGIILNIYMGLDVWDYSSLPYNFMGQICLFYSFCWFMLCLALNLILELIKKRIKIF